MRISTQDADKIRELIVAIDPDSKIYLFGSMVDDSKIGGDIDLFVESSFDINMQARLRLEWDISCVFDNDVDLLFRSPDRIEQPIHEIAKRGIRLL
jgi:predicted nucleotidyltransferase